MTHVQNVALLSAIQRQVGALAQIAEKRMHPAGNTADAGGRAAPDSAVRGPLQHRAAAQRHRLRHAGRHAGGPAGRDPRGARPQAGRSAPVAATTPAAGGVRMRATMTLPGETEAGSAGMQPCRGITWWAHRDDVGARKLAFRALPQNHIGSVDPYALKIPAPRGGILTNGERSLSISRRTGTNVLSSLPYIRTA